MSNKYTREKFYDIRDTYQHSQKTPPEESNSISPVVNTYLTHHNYPPSCYPYGYNIEKEKETT